MRDEGDGGIFIFLLLSALCLQFMDYELYIKNIADPNHSKNEYLVNCKAL